MTECNDIEGKGRTMGLSAMGYRERVGQWG